MYRVENAPNDGGVLDERPLLREKRVLDADGPPEQPGLSHRDFVFNFEYTVASAEPTDVVSETPIENERAFAYSARWLGDLLAHNEARTCTCCSGAFQSEGRDGQVVCGHCGPEGHVH